jgi:cell filamentation protein
LEQIDFDSLQAIHKRLFGKVYRWAGKLRTIEINKGNTRFAFSQYLDTLGPEVFAHLAEEDWLRGLEREALVERLAHYYSELNVLHPFREGNGRAIRTVLSLLAQQLGWVINWDDMTAEENVEACSYGQLPATSAKPPDHPMGLGSSRLIE